MMFMAPVLLFFLLLGFPFLVLIKANKQDGWLKVAGWILAGLFTLVLIVAAICMIATCAGGRGRGKMLMRFGGNQGSGCCQMMGGQGQGMMCGPGMMMNGGECPMMGKDAQGNVFWQYKIDKTDATTGKPKLENKVTPIPVPIPTTPATPKTPTPKQP